MAEICLACYNKLTDQSLTSDDVLLTDETYLCGVCEKMCCIVIIVNGTKDVLYFKAPPRGKKQEARTREGTTEDSTNPAPRRTPS